MAILRAHVASLLLAILLWPLSSNASAQTARANAPSARDSAEVARVVLAFRAALASGDSTTALSLLATDAVILESGDIETREEYRRHHLPADIEFSRAMRSEHSPIRVRVEGTTAWASSSGTTQGEFRGRPVDSAGAELMVLTRDRNGRWSIRAIHWSSHSRRAQRPA